MSKNVVKMTEATLHRGFGNNSTELCNARRITDGRPERKPDDLEDETNALEDEDNVDVDGESKTSKASDGSPKNNGHDGSPKNNENDGSPKNKKSEKAKDFLKETGLFALKTAVISGAVIGGTALLLPVLGFGALGPTSGSLAATYQSAVLGGRIASGSTFATLQRVGMVGLSAKEKTVIVAGSAAASAATSAASKMKQRSKKGKDQ